ncbi:MAG TPA: LacI family DNA-binding transcriptional regulator [Herpetosiphonaceae bacterium]|nr:LacI family DNA-binding transcriptional regulator [Herpetosiphonaceae bacterium]
MATIYDVAKKAGVSIGTVSRYVNGSGYVGGVSRDRIEAVIRELNFSPNGVARSLTTKRTYLLGFIVSDLMNPFVPEVARGIQDLADEKGYCVLILNTDGDGRREVRALKLLRERQVDGLIITPPETRPGNTYIRELHRLGVPIILLGRQVGDASIDRVSTDTYAGSRAAMAHLLDLGHRRIAFIGGDASRHVAASRRQGYLDGLAEAGIMRDPALIIETTLDHDGGAVGMAALLQLPDPPTAVFTVNDLMALGAVEEAGRRGVSVPADLSIVGFDDIALAAHARPTLTTVAQPKLNLGRTAAELLMSRLEHPGKLEPRNVRLPCEFVQRASSAPPRRQQAVKGLRDTGPATGSGERR